MNCFYLNKCFFCNHYKFQLYDIHIYNDLQYLYGSISEESYPTCSKCIVKLVKKYSITIS